jgi:CheY-like chemotaxis protein
MSTSTGAKTILVVDDDFDFINQQKVRLEKAGFNVVTAESQRRAEELLSQTRPDLAVVDLMMEYKDSGFALCYHIKKKDPSIPVILVTAVTSETGLEFDAATEEERLWVKADAMLAKPLRFEQLLGEIQQLLKGQQ